MYNFIDVIETQEGALLPSEALMINGEYIENLIEGYRTLTVEGREALSPEILTSETGLSDGSKMRGKRYPARIIRVTYQLAAESNEAFRDAYNKLAAILNVTDARLIFADEQDKYFTGTPSYIGEVPPGRNIVIGEFEITCLDPFKYSVMEYEAAAEPGESSIMLNYGGTYKSYPILQADFYKENEASEDGETATPLTGNGDCGFVAFFNEDEKIVQLGDPDEADGDKAGYPMSQTLVNQSFYKQLSWGSAARAAWSVNSGITSSSAVVQTGTIGAGIATYKTSGTPNKTTATILTARSIAEKPYVDYKVTATATMRSENKVCIVINVYSSLYSEESFFWNSGILKANIVINGTTRTLTLKNADEDWTGTTVHNQSFNFWLNIDAAQTVLSGITFEAYRADTIGASGILSKRTCSSFTIPAYTLPTSETYYLRPSSFGTGTDWHGPSITHTIPADASGATGAEFFTLTWSQKIGIGNVQDAIKQCGAFQVLAVSGSGANRKIVAGVNVYKGATGKKAKLRFYVNNTVVETTEIDLSYSTRWFGFDRQSEISKYKDEVWFHIGGTGQTLHYHFKDAGITDVPVTEITFTFSQFGTKPTLSYNGLYWAKFVKNVCETWKDIPNKFSANDVVEADCKTGEILLNGAAKPSLGALGNDWEGFYLTPGLNQIGTAYSDWVTAEYAPAFKLRYREVFL